MGKRREGYTKEYQRRPERVAYRKNYYKNLSAEKKAKYRKSSNAWHKTHRELDSSRAISSRQAWRDKAVKKLGGRCANPGCGWINSDGTHGCMDTRCLQIDHVNGGGSKEQKACQTYYKKVFLDENGTYQLLCANCNWIKRFVNREHR